MECVSEQRAQSIRFCASRYTRQLSACGAAPRRGTATETNAHHGWLLRQPGGRLEAAAARPIHAYRRALRASAAAAAAADTTGAATLGVNNAFSHS